MDANAESWGCCDAKSNFGKCVEEVEGVYPFFIFFMGFLGD